MEIFIDEAGQFTKHTGWSAICALTLPHREVGQARRKISYSTKDWPRAPNGELKGGSLDVDHLRKLSDLLFERGALLHLSAIDMGIESDEGLAVHKNLQCESMTRNLTEEHHPDVIARIWELRRTLERMPMQLYVQTVLMRDLVASVIEDTTLYFSQRRPQELAIFEWTIDAKDPLKVTTHEQWWLDTVGPLLESRGRTKPLKALADPSADYSFFDKSFSLQKELWHPHEERKVVDGYDIRKVVIDNINFVDSRTDVLIQSIDIFSNFFRRLLNEHVSDPEVARCLGRNQIKRKIDGNYQSASLLSLSCDGSERFDSIGGLIQLMGQSGRPMLLPKRTSSKRGNIKSQVKIDSVGRSKAAPVRLG
ncbi:hypothetical protein LNAOJCKE_0448 [Methylorubrum aminovorans]|uniref:DUF3800 domain-containing protein n=1 Tax=Methylorubrum aminovorans TaxID=269069 RepID=A0ABQ4U730_9HYPH|nr:DUF3800 domain-containing protein [Methylorubrum aminovorans]GJE63254.1 hypothetical protein LNAOJCKE_0448 [Methylorubrum aminovorans]GMA79306.1 hypothetical protein GCM10025880_57230 [Methylorubrum aminovorans]